MQRDDMRKAGYSRATVAAAAVLCFIFMAGSADASDIATCTECHASYCEAWQNTAHGMTMMPYAVERTSALVTPQPGEIVIGSLAYSYKTDGQVGWIEEKSQNSQANYRISWLLGGRSMLSFITTLPQGKLKILPLAYDRKKKSWFDNSPMLPHGTGRERGGSRPASGYFGTDCFFCHVDSTFAFYTPQTDTYAMPASARGISCNSCHGNTDAHVHAARAAQAGGSADDLKIFSFKAASPRQVNDTCGSCHSAHVPLAATYDPGKPYFDYFDLQALESPLFFPDGRTVGDGHVLTQWLMSPCAQSGKLHCLQCHTGGGASRYQEQSMANAYCLPCHQAKVDNVSAHSHHKKNSPGSLCVSCHMPAMEIKKISRTDHSFRPPLPSATRAFKSPDACMSCHATQGAAWGESRVKAWYPPAYQQKYLDAAQLVKAARNGDWSKLPAMLSYIENPKHDEITAVSLIRLLRHCASGEKWPVFINSVKNDPSPLVRAAAAVSLKGSPMGDTASALFAALGDGSAVVRIRAVSMLAMLSSQSLLPEFRPGFEKAFGEFTKMLAARADDPESYFNLGNLFLERQDFQKALAMYDFSLKLEPENPAVMLNSAMAAYSGGQIQDAERRIRTAIGLQPSNSQAHVTLGMLLIDQQRPVEAESAFRTAMREDPANAAAFYNLAVLKASGDAVNSLEWSRRAHELEPDNPKYGYTYAFYLNRGGKQDAAVSVLKPMIQKQVPHPESYALLAQIYLKQHKKNEARSVYRKALENKSLPQDIRSGFAEELQKLE